jgi:hypothetical protein
VTFGNACSRSNSPEARARPRSSASAAVAIPRPWNAGATVQPVSWMRSPSCSASQIPIVPAGSSSGSATITSHHGSPDSTSFMRRR